MKYLLLILSLLISSNLAAIEISSMFEIIEKDRTSFTVKNIDKHRIFLHIGMSQLRIVNGEIVKTPYTRENIDQWEITVRPAKTIIEPGFEKQIEVTYRCKTKCDDIIDEMFQLAVVPTPYFPEGKPNNNAVQVAIGFAPIVAVIKKDQTPNYKIKHLGETVEFTNLGTSLYKVVMDSCDDIKICRSQAKILPGRVLNFKLPEKMQQQTLTVKLSSALDKNETTHVISVDQVLPK